MVLGECLMPFLQTWGTKQRSKVEHFGASSRLSWFDFWGLAGKASSWNTRANSLSYCVFVEVRVCVRERTFAYVLVNLLSAPPVAVTHFTRSPLISHPSPSSFSFCSPSPHPSTHIRQHLKKKKCPCGGDNGAMASL